MLRRITYTVGWLTMAVPTRVRGCANVGALTALDVLAQSEQRSAKIEASPQMDSVVRPEIQIDRSSARLTAPQSQPTDGAITHRRQGFQPGERSLKSNKYHCGHCGFRSPYEGKVQDHWVSDHGMSTEEAARVMTAQNPDLSLDKRARRGAQFKYKPGNPKSILYHCGHCSRQSTSEQVIRDHSVEKHGMSTEEAARVMMAQNPDLSLDTPARRGPQPKRKPGEYDPKFKLYHCGHCCRQSTSEQVIRNHWVEKHEMSTEEAASVMAAQNPDLILDTPVRRGAQFKFKPGERNPRNTWYHCGYCAFSWSNALTVCKHWVEKHGMSTDEAVSVMTAQNPDVSLDKRARRGPQPKHKPGEYNPKFKLYRCGHCSRQSSSERSIRNHWVEKHGMAAEEAARVMAAQNPSPST
jgi:hypothetical protein